MSKKAKSQISSRLYRTKKVSGKFGELLQEYCWHFILNYAGSFFFSMMFFDIMVNKHKIKSKGEKDDKGFFG